MAASAGIAVSPDHGTSVDVLLQHADVAMYLSKESGEVELYDTARDRNSPTRLALLGELRRAMETDELVLHFQPKADLLTNQVTGVEALVRWRHPERGLVPPDEFVPLAESSGLMVPLTAWVLDAALSQLAVWRTRGWELGLAVNVSVKDLCGDQLVDRVTEGLAKYGIPASLLQLEVTEGSLFSNSMQAQETLLRLEATGRHPLARRLRYRLVQPRPAPAAVGQGDQGGQVLRQPHGRRPARPGDRHVGDRPGQRTRHAGHRRRRRGPRDLAPPVGPGVPRRAGLVAPSALAVGRGSTPGSCEQLFPSYGEFEDRRAQA